MDFAALPPFVRLAIVAAGLFLAYQIYVQLTIGARRRALQRQAGCEPVTPFPQRDTILGISMFLETLKAFKGKRFLALNQSRYNRVGLNTFSAVTLGRRVQLTIEPQNLKTIQAVDSKKWGLGQRRKTSFRPLLGIGIFTTDGSDWQHSREMLRPNFVRSQVGDLPTFEKHVAQLIKAVPTDGRTVDLSELFFRLTIDSATEFLFGESTDSLTTTSSEGFAEAFNRGQDHIANSSRWGFWSNFLPQNKQFAKDAQFVHDFVDYYVDKGLQKRPQLLASQEKSDSTRYIFIEELVRQTTDRVRIRSELLNILLAGRDTTASLLTNTWWVLSKRPDIYARVEAEIAHLDGQAPTFEQLKELKYVRALLNESLRLHPVVPVNSREALEDTTLPLGGGKDGLSPIFVPKGQTVAWSLYAMHRRTDYYGADAEDFRPERWLDDPVTGRKGLRPGWEYLPFNGGARICLGQQYALAEASYTTVRLCQAFCGAKLESRDPSPDWVEGLALTCVNASGAKVALTPRKA